MHKGRSCESEGDMVTEDDISEVTSESSNSPNANGKHKRKGKNRKRKNAKKSNQNSQWKWMKMTDLFNCQLKAQLLGQESN